MYYMKIVATQRLESNLNRFLCDTNNLTVYAPTSMFALNQRSTTKVRVVLPIIWVARPPCSGARG